MKQLSKNLYLCTTDEECEIAMSGHNDLGGAIPAAVMKPSKHQTPSGIEPTKPKQRGRNHEFKV